MALLWVVMIQVILFCDVKIVLYYSNIKGLSNKHKTSTNYMQFLQYSATVIAIKNWQLLTLNTLLYICVGACVCTYWCNVFGVKSYFCLRLIFQNERKKWDLPGVFKVKSRQTGVEYEGVHWVSGEKVRTERKNLLHFISFKDGDRTTCCCSAQRKLLFQLKSAFCLVLSLAFAQNDTKSCTEIYRQNSLCLKMDRIKKDW